MPTGNPYLLPPAQPLNLTCRASPGTLTASSRDICHILAFRTLLATAPLGAAGSSWTELPRMVGQQAGILKELVFSSDLGASGTQ